MISNILDIKSHDFNTGFDEEKKRMAVKAMLLLEKKVTYVR